MKLLFGISGSIAAIKINEIVEKLKEKCELMNIPIEIKYVATRIAFDKFLKNFKEKILLDEDEWIWNERGDEILHIELRKWADVFVICPLDANTLAYISNGACPNLLSSHNEEADQCNFFVGNKIDPIEKVLACGEYGKSCPHSSQVVVNAPHQTIPCCIQFYDQLFSIFLK
ncbi:phosphopantothenoylcysteine decarboxylase, putative [Plasmodium malariae]|uniref:Phosphopantothenoylcysteine decarboxylase, putative n=1 Tax=Plasmodium malariae TaxID=5858 RepID=A0A1A8X155_PLAMA|nr:phosphopantothenoylcysteine decarboxylase, putative [Plasmodium malariae]